MRSFSLLLITFLALQGLSFAAQRCEPAPKTCCCCKNMGDSHTCCCSTGKTSKASHSPSKKAGSENPAAACNCGPLQSQSADKAAVVTTNSFDNSLRIISTMQIHLPWYYLDQAVSTIADTPPPGSQSFCPLTIPLRI
jgi:hypothetical protein